MYEAVIEIREFKDCRVVRGRGVARGLITSESRKMGWSESLRLTEHQISASACDLGAIMIIMMLKNSPRILATAEN